MESKLDYCMAWIMLAGLVGLGLARVGVVLLLWLGQ